MGKIRIFLKGIALKDLISITLIIIVFNIVYSFYLTSVVNKSIDDGMIIQKEVMNVANTSLSNYLTSIEVTLLELSSSTEIQAFVENNSENETLENRFINIMTYRPEFTQIRFIDNTGFENIRVNNNETFEITPQNELQDKSSRDYFINTKLLEDGEIFLSKLDYNVEQEQIVIPYEPVIRIATPIYIDEIFEGLLIINIDALYIMEFLSEFDDISSFNLSIGLGDENSYWSFSADNQHSYIYYQKDITEGIDLTPYFYKGTNLIYSNDSYLYDSLEFTNNELVHYHEEGGHDNLRIISVISRGSIEHLPQNVFLFSPYTRIFSSLLLILIFHLVLMYLKQLSGKIKYSLVSSFIADFTLSDVIVTDGERKTLYVNAGWKNTYGYDISEILGIDPVSLTSSKFRMGSPTNSISLDKSLLSEYLVWNMSKSGVHIMKDLRLKTIHSFNKQDSFHVGIYHNPEIIPIVDESTNYSDTTEKFNKMILEYLHLKLANIKKGKNTLVTLRFNQVRQIEDEKVISKINILSTKLTRKLVDTYSNVDTFLINKYRICYNIESTDYTIESIIQEILFSIQDILGEDFLNITLNIGASSFEGDLEKYITSSFYALDHAIYYKELHTIYTSKVRDSIYRYYQILSKIDDVFIEGHLSVVYQPQRNSDTREIVSCEALVRWVNQELGIIYPNEFIAIIIEKGHITDLTKAVVRMVLSDTEKYFELIPKGFKISINITVEDLEMSNLKNGIIQMINDSKVPNDYFAFEVVEDMLIKNVKDISTVFNYIRSQGIAIHIDDFGTGYSSLGYLANFTFDKIKVDRKFIMNYPQNDKGTIIKLIKTMANDLNVPVIIEGVETDNQLKFIQSLKCQQYQGFIDSKPTYLGNFVRKIIIQEFAPELKKKKNSNIQKKGI